MCRLLLILLLFPFSAFAQGSLTVAFDSDLVYNKEHDRFGGFTIGAQGNQILFDYSKTSLKRPWGFLFGVGYASHYLKASGDDLGEGTGTPTYGGEGWYATRTYKYFRYSKLTKSVAFKLGWIYNFRKIDLRLLGFLQIDQEIRNETLTDSHVNVWESWHSHPTMDSLNSYSNSYTDRKCEDIDDFSVAKRFGHFGLALQKGVSINERNKLIFTASILTQATPIFILPYGSSNTKVVSCRVGFGYRYFLKKE